MTIVSFYKDDIILAYETIKKGRETRLIFTFSLCLTMEWSTEIGKFTMKDACHERIIFKLKIIGEENARIRRIDVHYLNSDIFFCTFSKDSSEKVLTPYKFLVNTNNWWWKNLQDILFFDDTGKRVNVGSKQYPVWKPVGYKL